MLLLGVRAVSECRSPGLLTSQRCNGLPIAFYAPQLSAIDEVCEQHILSHARCQYAPVLAQRQASSRIDWLNCPVDLVRRPYGCSLRHYRTGVECEARVLSARGLREVLPNFFLIDTVACRALPLTSEEVAPVCPSTKALTHEKQFLARLPKPIYIPCNHSDQHGPSRLPGEARVRMLPSERTWDGKQLTAAGTLSL